MGWKCEFPLLTMEGHLRNSRREYLWIQWISNSHRIITGHDCYFPLICLEIPQIQFNLRLVFLLSSREENIKLFSVIRQAGSYIHIGHILDIGSNLTP